MKTSPIHVALVAVVSSVVTVGVIELLRGPRPEPALAVERTSAPAVEERAAPEVELVSPVEPAPILSADYEERLAELERRLMALELGPVREPAAEDPAAESEEALPPREELRDLVLDWIAEEREERGRAAELEAVDEKRKALEFDGRYQAHMFAQEHGLAEWQEERFAQLFIETAERAQKIEDSIDLTRDDPAQIEARFAEFDEWCDRRERELTLELDPGLYQEIYGDE